MRSPDTPNGRMALKTRLFKVHMPGDLTTVLETMRSGFVAEGPRVVEFEGRVSEFVGATRTVALDSGTSAIQLALVLAGVKHASKVISTPVTSPATNVCIATLGAQIIWADVDRSTGNISANSVCRLMDQYGEEVAAVVAVHWGGYPCDMDAIEQAVAGRAYIIEDAAHSLSAEYKGRPVGSISDLTCFSFQAIKHITTGDGGLLTCRRSEDYERARRLRWFGVERSRPGRTWADDFEEPGYKMHMNDIAATLGLLQLDDLPGIVERRRRIAGVYERELTHLAFQKSSYECRSSYWLFTLFVESRDDFIRAMEAQGIECSPVHPRNDGYTAFAEATFATDDLEGVDYVASRMACIPVGQWLSDEEVNSVVAAVDMGW